MNIDTLNAKEIFIKELELVQGKIACEFFIEKLTNHCYYRAKVPGGNTLLTDLGVFSGDIVVHTFENKSNNHLRTTIYKRNKNNRYEFRLVSTKESVATNRTNFMDYIDRLITKPDDELLPHMQPTKWERIT